MKENNQVELDEVLSKEFLSQSKTEAVLYGQVSEALVCLSIGKDA